MKKIALVNGPNLNLLGQREQKLYGQNTLENIIADLKKKFHKNYVLESFQSNHEGEVVDYIQQAKAWAEGLVINAGALTHTSIAIRDSILAIELPCIEIHLTNIYAREEFRHKSVIASTCVGQVTGFGAYSYELGILALVEHLHKI